MKRSYDLRNFTEDQFVQRAWSDSFHEVTSKAMDPLNLKIDAQVRSINRRHKGSILKMTVTRKTTQPPKNLKIPQSHEKYLRRLYRENSSNDNPVIIIDTQARGARR